MLDGVSAAEFREAMPARFWPRDAGESKTYEKSQLAAYAGLTQLVIGGPGPSCYAGTMGFEPMTHIGGRRPCKRLPQVVNSGHDHIVVNAN